MLFIQILIFFLKTPWKSVDNEGGKRKPRKKSWAQLIPLTVLVKGPLPKVTSAWLMIDRGIKTQVLSEHHFIHFHGSHASQIRTQVLFKHHIMTAVFCCKLGPRDYLNINSDHTLTAVFLTKLVPRYYLNSTSYHTIAAVVCAKLGHRYSLNITSYITMTAVVSAKLRSRYYFHIISLHTTLWLQ